MVEGLVQHIQEQMMGDGAGSELGELPLHKDLHRVGIVSMV